MSFARISLEKLSIEEVKKALGSDSVHINLHDAKIGRQVEKTFVLARIEDVREVVMTSDNTPRIQVLFKDVIGDKSAGIIFVGYVFGNLCQHISQSMTHGWVCIENAQFARYTGKKNEWSKIMMRMRDSEAKLTFFQEKKPEKNSQKYTYTNINRLITDVRGQNIFAVVKEVIKYQVQNRANSNRHTLLALIDPSCINDSAQMKDFLLHIFLNNSAHNFPCTIQVGDVIRVKQVDVKMWSPPTGSARIEGKIYNPFGITVFKREDVGEDGDSQCVPYNCKEYCFSDQDKELEADLFGWWDSIKDLFAVTVASDESFGSAGDPLLLERTIARVTKEMKFSIYCQIAEVNYSSNLSILLIKANDGTKCSVYSVQYDFENLTQDFLDSKSDIAIDRPCIDIRVHDHDDLTSSLTLGAYVYLKNIKATKIHETANGVPVLDFEMSKELKSSIKVLSPNDAPIKEVIKRINASISAEANSDSTNKDNSDSTPNSTNPGRSMPSTSHQQDPDLSQTFLPNDSSSPKSQVPVVAAVPASLPVPRVQLTPLTGLDSFLQESLISSTDRHIMEFVTPEEERMARRSRVPQRNQTTNEMDSDPFSSLKSFKNKSFKRKSFEITSSANNSMQRSSSRLEASENGPSHGKSQPACLPSDKQQCETSNKSCEGPSHQQQQQHPHEKTLYSAQVDESLLLESPSPSIADGNDGIASGLLKGLQSSQNNTNQIQNQQLSPSGSKTDVDSISSGSSTSSDSSHNANQNKVQPPPSEIEDGITLPISQSRRVNQPETNIPIHDIRGGASPSRPICFQHLPVYTECADAPRRTIFSVVNNFDSNSVVKSWVVFKSVCVETERPCEQCSQDVVCIHDWIHGLCELCGNFWQPWELRQEYSPEALQTLRQLKCSKCTEVAKRKKKRRPSPSIVPFIRLLLTVLDVNERDRELKVQLSGDQAEEFFGNKCSFKWLVAEPNSDVSAKAAILKRYKGPIEICMLNLTDLGTLLTDTKLMYR